MTAAPRVYLEVLTCFRASEQELIPERGDESGLPSTPPPLPALLLRPRKRARLHHVFSKRLRLSEDEDGSAPPQPAGPGPIGGLLPDPTVAEQMRRCEGHGLVPPAPGSI
ncbi:unnamed protein product [Schistocephalus solidus]|uniref:Uncharacterized protein n=1 Tax=Schistocephalus solidus TaxID=70667 RepID=A0A183THI7_SCHSO|nr:unnamed protein product [Schistocephalus solidus]